jgi:Family of unknown function (DUF6600)
VPAVIVVVAFVSCQKQQTEAEKNAEIERQVQERLAAEHQTQQQQQLDQRQADLDAREKALADKENAAATTPARRERAESETDESRTGAREPRERAVSVGYSTFYNKLDRYGDWIETGDYGYVFHPREAEGSAHWRPYTNGRWVYTDAGWTWISEEPFGWATYHYGRWTRLRGIGWVWVPGNQWAPAWVSWRKSNDYVGWAPLPPEARFDQRTGIRNWSDSYYDVGPDQYCFVASREFGAPRIEQTLLPPERNVTIINQTTNVTNITYNNTTIVNEGPNYEELRSISREPVQRYRLERNVSVDLASEPSRGEVRGETVFIAAPVIAQPVANERPPTVKQTIAAVTIDLGWAAIANQEEARKTRQKMKAEATPPPNAPPKKFAKAEAATSASAQTNETSAATSTSSTAAAAPSAAATATPEASRTVRPAATVAPSTPVTASATSAPISSASASPTASQRRGRLLVPSATPQPTAANSPAAGDTISPIPLTPPPEGLPAGSPQQGKTRGKFESQMHKYNPRRIEPMPSPSVALTPEASQSKGGWKGQGFKVPNESPALSAASTASPAAASTPVEKMTKQEEKEQKREEKKESKRERSPGAASPTATP